MNHTRKKTDLSQALTLSQANLNSSQRWFTPNDPRYLEARFGVGSDLLGLGRFRDAAERHESLLNDMAETETNHHALSLKTMVSLSYSYAGLQKFEKALDICNKANDELDSTVEFWDRRHCMLYACMGEALSNMGRPLEALQWAEKGLQAHQKIHGATNSGTFVSMHNIALQYARARQFEKAYALETKCFDLMKLHLGNDHPYTILAESTTLDLYAQSKSSFSRKRIIRRRKAVLEKMRLQFGELSDETLACEAKLAQDYFTCSALEKSKSIQVRLVELMTQRYGKDDSRAMEIAASLVRTRNCIAIRKAVYWWLPLHLSE